MTTATQIDRVTYRWDDQAGAESGWYCETWSEGERIDDSQKIWFPVGADSYSHDESADLEEALQEAFPNAEIEFTGN